MITAKGFWKGRDIEFARELTDEIRANAERTIAAANALLALFYAANPQARRRDATSGWRPAVVNAATPRAAKLSKHMLALAVDIEDADDRLDTWLMTPAGQAALVKCGLFMEHPSATKTWSHVQIVPPGSGRRVFCP